MQLKKEEYIKKRFKENVGYKIDFSKKPKIFNEKYISEN